MGGAMRKIKIIDREDLSSDRQFWEKKSPEERLSAVEFLREQYYVIQGFESVPRILKDISIRESCE